MRIVFDMQGAQTESRFQSPCRYTMGFAKGVARNRNEHEVILVLNGFFSDTIDAIREAFDGILPQENILVWHAPNLHKQESENDTHQKVASLIRNTFIASLDPDIVHITTPLNQFLDTAELNFENIDTSILLSFTTSNSIPPPSQNQKPLLEPKHSYFYNQKLEELSKRSVFIAASESSRHEAILLGCNYRDIINASVGVEMKSLSAFSGTMKDNLCDRFHIHKSFILCSSECSEHDDLVHLIEAYSKLPSEIRSNYQLVFTEKKNERSAGELKSISKQYDLNRAELIFLGDIPDKELAVLINLCTVYVISSLHEELIFLALEAMAYGAIVIGPNTPSFNEVIGLADALFDPLNIASITEKLQVAVLDENFRQNFLEHAQSQIRKFSWDKTGGFVLNFWQHMLVAKTQGKTSRTTKGRYQEWSHILHFLDEKHQQLVDALGKVASLNKQLSDQDMVELAKCIEINERNISFHYRCIKLPEKVRWRIEGPFDSSYSLALVNRETARALDGLGHDVFLHSTEGPGDFDPNPNFLVENPEVNKLFQKRGLYPLEDMDITSRNLYPPRVASLNSRWNLLHGYAWEESEFPSAWVDEFNSTLQGILVTSNHVKKVLIDNGVSVPIFVTGNGVDHWQKITSETAVRPGPHKFKFLHVSSCFPRKAVDTMLEAYGRSFSKQDDVSLVIKTFENPHNKVHLWLSDVRKKFRNYPEVVLVEDDLSDSELKALYEKCDALVAPSRAEGFGLPMGEAMLSGLPVITTNWGGQVDFCTQGTSWLVDYQFEQANTHFNLFNSVWANPDVESLASVMREVFETPFCDLQKRNEAGRQMLLNHFTWNKVAEKMIAAAAKVSLGLPPFKQNIGWISTWNSKCGIATSSKYLIDNMFCDEPMTIFAPQNQDLILDDAENIYRNWTIGNGSNDLVAVKKTITSSRINTLIIQFEYGFFNHQELAEFIEICCDRNLVIIVILNSIVEPTNKVPSRTNELKYLMHSLKRCSRILVHSVSHLNRLKCEGLVQNVALFPWGVPDYESQRKRRPNAELPIVASYIFFHEKKGALELIEVASILQKRGTPIRLKLLFVDFLVPDSALLIQSVKRKVKNSDLQNLVELKHLASVDHESLKFLLQVDLLVCSHHNSDESSMKGVRNGLIIKVPVLVTPLKIFDVFGDSVHRCKGFLSKNIADSIIQTLNSIAGNTFEAQRISIQADAWREAHSYRNLGKRLKNICVSLFINNYLEREV